jgi:hypothetical protein
MKENNWVDRQFRRDERLGISVPALETFWEDLTLQQQEAILARWEMERGEIPERIIEFEKQIRQLQELMAQEEDFAACCRINDDISEMASRINDLNIWFRVRQDLDAENKRHA